MIRLTFASLFVFTSLSFTACTGRNNGGEGEGEGAAGEGEGAAGEGEGEGEGEGAGGDVGDQSNPKDVTVSVGHDDVEQVTFDTAGDVDCYRFTIADTLVLTASTSGACDGETGSPDTILDVDDATGANTIVENDDDASSATATHCSKAQALLAAGTYQVCASAFEQGVGGGITLILHVETPTPIADGDPCDPTNIVQACTATSTSQCLFNGATNVCGTPVTLASNATCVVGDELHVCDATATPALSCLSVSSPTDFHCTTVTPLAVDATCIPGVTASVCDPDARLSCLDVNGNGSSFKCENAQDARCVGFTEIPAVAATPQITNFPATVTTTDFADAQCNGNGGDDLVLHYVVQSPRARVQVSGTGIAGLELRSTCADPTTSFGCVDASSTAVAVPDLSAGDGLFIILDADANGDGSVGVTVSEEPINTLADGADCVLNDTVNLCASTSACFLAKNASSATCTALTNGGDKCETATALAGASGFVIGTTAGFAGDYSFGTFDDSCTGFETNGADAVYSIDIAAGKTLTATVTPLDDSFDPAIYVVDTCPMNAPTDCVAGADANGGGQADSLTFTNSTASATTFFVVIDAFFEGSAGPYQLDYAVQ